MWYLHTSSKRCSGAQYLCLWRQLLLIGTASLVFSMLVGCGTPSISQVSPTVTVAPTSCPAATEMPASTAPPSPTEPALPAPTATEPFPPTPTSPCSPPGGVQPVSSVEIDQGNTSRQQIALTFDAGGPATPTAQILDILAKYHLRVTWFVTGQWAQDNPSLLRGVAADGHEIGNHTMTHPDLTTVSDVQVCQELTLADQVISGITGHTTRPYFRPPYGARNAQVRSLAANLGYRTVYWTIDTIDWREDATPQSITDKVMNHLSNGVIVLMHAGSAVEAQTLDGLIANIQQKGYQIVTLTQLLR